MSVIAKVAAPKVSLKVTPPDCVTVTVPMFVPTASATVTAPVVLIVRLETAPPPFAPVIASKSIWFAAPAPTVSVAASATVASPKEMVPVDVPPTNKFAATVTPVSASPKVSTPVPPSAFTVP